MTDALHAFAAATEGELDDAAVGYLDEGIRRALDAADQTAHYCSLAAAFIEANGPVIGSTIRAACDSIERRGPAVIERARRIGAGADVTALKATIFAGAAGVMAVKARTRIEALTRGTRR